MECLFLLEKSEACIDDEGLSYLIVLLDQKQQVCVCVWMCVKSVAR